MDIFAEIERKLELVTGLRQSRAMMSHDLKSNSSLYTQKAHLITGSLRIISYSNLLEISAKNESFRPYNEVFCKKTVFKTFLKKLDSTPLEH